MRFYLVITLTLFACESKPYQDDLLRADIGTLIMIGFRGTTVTDTSRIVQDINRYRIGNIVLFDYDVPTKSRIRNIISPEQVRTLTDDLRKSVSHPLLIAVDQEGGYVRRLKTRHGFADIPSAEDVAAGGLTAAEAHYDTLAMMLKSAGIDWNLAPVVDVNVNPDNPIIGGIERSYSSNPDTVTLYAERMIRALRRHGRLNALKHFPGHGSSESDSHLGMVDVSESWKPFELQPYRSLIQDSLVDVVMTAHVFLSRYDSTRPATLSKNVLTGLLRDSLGFQGVIMTDDMDMGAIRQQYGTEEAVAAALDAGADMIVFSNNGSVYYPRIAKRAYEAIYNLLKKGRITRDDIHARAERIRQLRERVKN